MIDIEANIAALNARIKQVSTKKVVASPLPLLVAVSKKQPVAAIREAVRAGQRHFGENYLQEAVVKIREIDNESLVWHFLGPIQSNKTRSVADNFDWVHSVDRLKIAQRLSDQRARHKGPLNICLQVNIDTDPAKSGVHAENALPLARQVAELPGIHLRGLMAVPARSSSMSDPRPSFVCMRELFLRLRGSLGCSTFDCLSMGMSADMDIAIEEGANIVRIGTAIFGERRP